MATGTAEKQTYGYEWDCEGYPLDSSFSTQVAMVIAILIFAMVMAFCAPVIWARGMVERIRDNGKRNI